MNFKDFMEGRWYPIKGSEITIGPVKLKLVKNVEWGEFVVRWIENGKVDDNKSYHTDDLKDAMMTMDAMAKQLVART